MYLMVIIADCTVFQQYFVCRRHFRDVLKQQMSDRKVMDKQDFQHKIVETEQAISYDRQCRDHDSKEYHKKHNYLMQYRDGNKQVRQKIPSHYYLQ